MRNLLTLLILLMANAAGAATLPQGWHLLVGDLTNGGRIQGPDGKLWRYVPTDSPCCLPKNSLQEIVGEQLVGPILDAEATFASQPPPPPPPVYAGQAATATIGEEFGVGPGLTTIGHCPSVNGRQCVSVPAGWWLHGFTGTATVKQPNVEALGVILLETTDGPMTLWQGERFQGTSTVFMVLPRPIQVQATSARAWVWASIANNSGAYAPGVYEVQVTLYFTRDP